MHLILDKRVQFNKILKNIRFKVNNRTIIFKDSLLLLPSSLRKLCKAFNVESSKGHFPFLLFDINSVGPFPFFEEFTDLNKKEYLELRDNFYNSQPSQDQPL